MINVRFWQTVTDARMTIFNKFPGILALMLSSHQKQTNFHHALLTRLVVVISLRGLSLLVTVKTVMVITAIHHGN